MANSNKAPGMAQAEACNIADFLALGSVRCNAKRVKAVSPSVGSGYTAQVGIHTIGSVPVTTAREGHPKEVALTFGGPPFCRE
jgi:hypothetical protein